MKRFISTDKTRKDNRLLFDKKINIASVIFILIIVVLWQIATYVFDIKTYVLPSPLLIIEELIDSFPLLLIHGKATIIEVIVGFVTSLLISIILAILMDRFELVKKTLYPLMIISQTIPLIAIAPILMIWFGFGLLPKIIVVVLVCFFPIVINFTMGLESVDQELIDLMKSMKASEFQIFIKCKLPSALPSFFIGLKIAATYSVMGAVLSEWMGATEGLGIFLTRVMKTYQTAALFADILVIVIITLLFVALVDLLAKISMPWKKER